MSRTGQRGSKVELEALLDEALVDAYGEAEQATALFTSLEEHLQVPFETTVLGVTATVQNLELTNRADDIAALCVRGRARQRIRIIDLSAPEPPPDGWVWVDAYRHWIGDER